MTKRIPIQVSTNGLSRRVWATSMEEAFKIYVERYKPKRMGLLVSFASKYLDDTYFSKTEYLLQKLGMLEVAA